jgi:HEAT repeat protein
MPVLAESLIHWIYILSLTIFLFTLGLVIAAIARRRLHERYFKRLDDLRKKCHPLLMGILTGGIPYNRGLGELKAITSGNSARMLERILLELRPAPEEAAIFGRLSADLGLVRIWQKRLARSEPWAQRPAAIPPVSAWLEFWGWRSFPERAKAAESLGRVQHRPSWRLLARALDDRDADVRNAAARALGEIGEPRAFPVLLEKLREATTALKPLYSPSLLTLSLSRFSLTLVGQVVPLLRDPDPRIRLTGMKVIHQMARQKAFEGKAQFGAEHFVPALRDALFGGLKDDPSPDVRSQVAMVLGYLNDPAALETLARLTEDREWFVRLQAVKSLGRNGIQGKENQVAQRLSDVDWRVREAAAHALRKQAGRGEALLLHHFLQTQDAYAKEQIVEELERSGLIAEWLSHAGDGGFEWVRRVRHQLALMGKTRLLGDLVQKPIGRGMEPAPGDLADAHPPAGKENRERNTAGR